MNETNSLLGDRFKFTGRELNSGSDYYYRARTYNASQGRFGSLDTFRFLAGDSNLFRYVNNNANAATDPTGRFAVVDRAAVETALVGAARGAIGGLGCGVATSLVFDVAIPLLGRDEISFSGSVDNLLASGAKGFLGGLIGGGGNGAGKAFFGPSAVNQLTGFTLGRLTGLSSGISSELLAPGTTISRAAFSFACNALVAGRIS